MLRIQARCCNSIRFEKTLKDIGAEHQPRLLLLNKIDQVEDSSDKLIWVSRCPDAIQISAVTKEGIEEFTEEVLLAVIGIVQEVTLSLPIRASKAIDFFRETYCRLRKSVGR